MTCEEFSARLLIWIDGEAASELDEQMRSHEAACLSCRGRGAAEQRFEHRIRAVLLAGTETVDARAMLRRSLDGESKPAPRRRIVAWRRIASSAAAAALAAVAGGWYLCIPPFECPYMEAVEAAATSPDTGKPVVGREFAVSGAPVVAPESILDFRLVAPPERLTLDLDGMTAPAMRARYTGPQGSVIVVWSAAADEEPSFRRLADRDGARWWIADERQCQLVAFRTGASPVLCTVITHMPEQDALRVAAAIRAGR